MRARRPPQSKGPRKALPGPDRPAIGVAPSGTSTSLRVSRRTFGLAAAGAALPLLRRERPQSNAQQTDYVPPQRPLLADLPPFADALEFTSRTGGSQGGAVPDVAGSIAARWRVSRGARVEPRVHDAPCRRSAPLYVSRQRRPAGGLREAVGRLGATGEWPTFERAARALCRSLPVSECAALRLDRRR